VIKHTLGPWKTDDIESGDCQRYVLAGNHEEAQIIARITLKTFVGPTQSESEANARLIAAAPELLEALVSFTKSRYIRHQHPKRFAAAVAAIAKATGEQP
jgi:acyl CoA:acetate/3-ketoacid CoA transferase